MSSELLLDTLIEMSSRTATDARTWLEKCRVVLLTGGGDRPYAMGLSGALSEQRVPVDFIGSTDLECAEITAIQGLTYVNLRGDQAAHAPIVSKVTRIIKYYFRLVRYAAIARARIFHILWNNKFELIDRVVLMAYYRVLGKRVVLTAHNVNIAKRDNRDTWWNRQTLRVQYRLCDHIFVHTARMKEELVVDFGVDARRVSIIPFGINETSPLTALTAAEARRHLGIAAGEKTALFFGQIAPYKGLSYLVEALSQLAAAGERITLIIAGKVKPRRDDYWNGIEETIRQHDLDRQIIRRVQFIPENDVELYFKAADVVVMPYLDIFQSGIPFLAYSFGLPIICTDVGGLKDDVIDGETGFVCAPRDAVALSEAIRKYFDSDLYRRLPDRREWIRQWAREHHSWSTVGEITTRVYRNLVAR